MSLDEPDDPGEESFDVPHARSRIQRSKEEEELAGPMIRIEVYTRSNCPLCDELAELLQQMADEFTLDVSWIDISTSSGFEKEFGNRVPVLMIDDRERFFGRVDPVLLRRTLSAEQRRRSDPSLWQRLTMRRHKPPNDDRTV